MQLATAEITHPAFAAIAIGRNEGDRLKLCLGSLSQAACIIYVDSGSSDGSVQWAKGLGVEVVELHLGTPFTAARARNAGFRHLRKLMPQLDYVQFIDGDCEIESHWPNEAISFLRSHEQICAVFGRVRERYPNVSIYNRLCDHEWNTPIGEAMACGGNVMMRVRALEAAGGYRDELIAGEEPELCVRLRALGWKIWRLDREMTLHDAALLHFGQWWRRQTRSGYAYAQGAQLHGDEPEKHWVWESRRALLWGLGFPAALIALAIFFRWWAAILLLAYPVQIARRMTAMPGRYPERLQFSFFEQLSRFPEAIGQVRFFRDRIFNRHPRLIEHK